MSEADKMFEELGYKKAGDEKVIDYLCIKYYTHFKVKKHIRFYKLDKELTLKSVNITENFETQFNITIPELKAINEKCKELGWLDE